MTDTNQILDKYAQLKADLKKQKEEEQRQVQEELDAKNPLKQYEKLQNEIQESKQKHATVLKEKRVKEEKEKKFQEQITKTEQTEIETKKLKNLENLFLKLGGNLEEIEEGEQDLHEDDIGLEPEVVEVAEKQQEDVVEEPTGVVEETIGHEEDIKVDERGEEEQQEIVKEEDTVEAVADTISKQEKDKEKSVKETPTSKRIKLLEEKVSKLIKDMSNVGGGGEVNLNKLDDVDISGIANNKILKYNSSTSKWEMATDSGGGGGGGSLTVSEINDPVTNISVSDVSGLKFNVDGGFALTDNGDDTVTVTMESTFKTWQVDGQTNLVASGVDTIELVGGTGTTITTDPTSSPKSITFTGTDLSTIDGNIVPDANNTRDLGSASKKWKDLYLSGGSLILGTTTLAVNETGNLTITPEGNESPEPVSVASNSFSSIAVSGQTTVAADQVNDTFTLVGTGDTTITTTAGTDTVTIDTTVDSLDGGNF